MSCLDDQTVLRFVAGQLDAAAQILVEAELARCARCAALVGAMMNEGEQAAGAPRYELGAAIARGGMGTVFRAIDRKLGREIAIKRLDARSRIARARFEREIEVTASLQHPNIVPIYDAGTLPDGQPFYAMRHVTGHTLDGMIAQAREQAQRLALLAPILSAADAVAYAHEHGVVHRDLKPLNILVGPFGETVVIDWGLAKRTDEPDPPGAAPDGELRTADPADATRSGTVLGTPRYMAPEQARGLPATAASDVYALGAILYHALFGEPAVDDGHAVLARVAGGAVVPISVRAPYLPRDLTAIVARAMAVQVADRYPSARELAADLRRFQTGQLVSAYRYSRPDRIRRFVRRNRIALSVAGMFTAVVAVVGATSIGQVVHERDLAHAANARAERHRVSAEELVQFMLVDLRRTLAGVGRLDALTGVADRVDGFLAHAGAERDEGPGLRRARARVLELRGEIASATGQLARAEQLADLAEGLLDVDAALAPGSLVTRQIRAELAIQRGALSARRHDDEAALRSYRAAAALWREMVGMAPSAEARLVGVLGSIAETAERLGHRDEVGPSQREAEDLLARARTRHPDDPELGLAQAKLGFSTGQAAARRGDLGAAEPAFRIGLGAADAVRARDPSNVEVIRVALMLLNGLADVCIARGANPEGAQLHERARVLAEQAVAIEPANRRWREELARSWRELSRDANAAGDLATSARRLELSVAEYERLLATAGGDRRLPRLAAIANAELGRTQAELRQVPAARAALIRAVGLFAELAIPGDPPSQLDLAFALREQAKLERTVGQPSAAGAPIARAVRIAAATPAQPERPTQDFYRAAVLAEAAAVEARAGRAGAAREHLAAASAIVADLQRRGALQPDWSAELGLP